MESQARECIIGPDVFFPVGEEIRTMFSCADIQDVQIIPWWAAFRAAPERISEICSRSSLLLMTRLEIGSNIRSNLLPLFFSSSERSPVPPPLGRQPRGSREPLAAALALPENGQRQARLPDGGQSVIENLRCKMIHSWKSPRGKDVLYISSSFPASGEEFKRCWKAI